MMLTKQKRLPRRHRSVRWTVAILSWFIAVTAIGGGVAILTGVDEFPLEWLRNTPFTSYTVPAVLLILVGASSLFAAVAILRRGVSGIFAAMVAGAFMAGYIVVEVLVLEQTPPGPTWTEYLYFALGALVFGLGLYLWRMELRQ